MFSYFIPISLLVLGGFALGLLVGRLAWASSKSVTDREPAEVADVRVSDEVDEATSPGISTTVDKESSELPVWQMKEVRSRQRQTAESPVEAGPYGRQRDDDPDDSLPNEETADGLGHFSTTSTAQPSKGTTSPT